MKRIHHMGLRKSWLAAIAVVAGVCCFAGVSRGQPTDEGPQEVRPVAGKVTAAEARIRAALEEPTRVEFVEVPIADAASYLAELHNIEIMLDTRTLNEVGVGNDEPISLAVQNVRLRSVLELMLRPLELTWLVRDEVLLITTRESAESMLVSHVYEVRDLMQSAHAADALDPEMLMDLITTAVEPVSWDDVGGPGSLSSFSGALIVSQTDAAHDQVQALLTELRRAKHALEHDPAKAFETRWKVASRADREAAARIQAALEKPIEPRRFSDDILAEAIALLAQQAGIPIEFDWMSVNEGGIDQSTRVTANVPKTSLGAALNLLLRPFELRAIVRDEVLMISTLETAESHLSTSAFVVRDLLESPLTAEDDAAEIIQLITNSIAPDTWDEVGGFGTMAHFPLIDALVVTQTDDVLEEVEALLGKLRQIRQMRDPWSAEEWETQRQELLTTPRFQVFVIDQEPSGQLSVDPHTIVEFLVKSVDEGLVERSQLKVTQNAVTLFLTPPEAAHVEGLLRKARLPVSRRPANALLPGGGRFSGGLGSGGGFF